MMASEKSFRHAIDGPASVADQTPVLDAQTSIDLFTGLLNVMTAFGVTLANRNLVTREEIVDMMTRVLDQQSRQPDDSAVRRAAAETIRDMFSRPVMEGGRGAAGLVAIRGGRDTTK